MATTPATATIARDTPQVSLSIADLLLRERLSKLLLTAGCSISSEAADADSVVISTSRVDANTLTTAKALRSSYPDLRLVLVCDGLGDGQLRRALAAGFDGVVLLSDAENSLVAVLSVVATGQVCVPRIRRGEVREQVLTSREKQILGLVVMGLTNAEIAGRLYLAESTVKSHLSSAFAKLDVSSRNEAVSLILDADRGKGLGILTIPSERMQPSLG
jgi:DNA-binding NarL/FixJ family response regulator